MDAGLDLLAAAPGADVQAGRVERAVEHEGSRVDRKFLAVGVERRAYRMHAALREDLARGTCRQVHLSRDAAVVTVGAQRQAVAEVEPEIEIQRQLRAAANHACL